ncbi:MAG: GntR family transcriptional regulator, partial [Gemmatimonadaceae bacterium]
MVQRRGDIATQLRQRLVAELHLGLRRPGDRLPSTRDLARELQADPRVVLAAYRELEDDGLVEFRPRSGVYVAEFAFTGRSSLPRLAAWALELFVEGLGRGVPAPELPERLRRCLETLRLHATCIECNLDQLHSLCHELHRDFGLDTTPLELDALNADGEEARAILRRTDILVTTSLHAADVKRAAERVGKPWFAITIGSELISEMTRLLRDGP